MPTDAMTPLDQIKAAAKAVIYEYNHPASGDGALWNKIHALEDALTADAAIRKPQDEYNNTVCPDCKVWPCKCPRVTR